MYGERPFRYFGPSFIFYHKTVHVRLSYIHQDAYFQKITQFRRTVAIQCIYENAASSREPVSQTTLTKQ